MRRLHSFGAVAGLAVLVVLAWAVVAAATPLQEYQSTGKISPCKYTAGQLAGGVPNDVAQYAPEYKAQLEAAARQRASGCGSSGGGSGSKSSTGAGASSRGSGGPRPHRPSRSAAPASVPAAPPIDPATGAPVSSTAKPAKTTRSGHGGISAWLLVLLIVGGLALLGGALALVGRYLGWSPRWAAPAVHALREAGMRIGTTAGGFADWLRPSPRSS